MAERRNSLEPASSEVDLFQAFGTPRHSQSFPNYSAIENYSANNSGGRCSLNSLGSSLGSPLPSPDVFSTVNLKSPISKPTRWYVKAVTVFDAKVNAVSFGRTYMFQFQNTYYIPKVSNLEDDIVRNTGNLALTLCLKGNNIQMQTRSSPLLMTENIAVILFHPTAIPILVDFLPFFHFCGNTFRLFKEIDHCRCCVCLTNSTSANYLYELQNFFTTQIPELNLSGCMFFARECRLADRAVTLKIADVVYNERKSVVLHYYSKTKVSLAFNIDCCITDTIQQVIQRFVERFGDSLFAYCGTDSKSSQVCLLYENATRNEYRLMRDGEALFQLLDFESLGSAIDMRSQQIEFTVDIVTPGSFAAVVEVSQYLCSFPKCQSLSKESCRHVVLITNAMTVLECKYKLQSLVGVDIRLQRLILISNQIQVFCDDDQESLGSVIKETHSPSLGITTQSSTLFFRLEEKQALPVTINVTIGDYAEQRVIKDFVYDSELILCNKKKIAMLLNVSHHCVDIYHNGKLLHEFDNWRNHNIITNPELVLEVHCNRIPLRVKIQGGLYSGVVVMDDYKKITIDEIKTKAATKSGIDLKKHYVIFNGRCVDDTADLHEHISDNSNPIFFLAQHKHWWHTQTDEQKSVALYCKENGYIEAELQQTMGPGVVLKGRLPKDWLIPDAVDPFIEQRKTNEPGQTTPNSTKNNYSASKDNNQNTVMSPVRSDSQAVPVGVPVQPQYNPPSTNMIPLTQNGADAAPQSFSTSNSITNMFPQSPINSESLRRIHEIIPQSRPTQNGHQTFSPELVERNVLHQSLYEDTNTGFKTVETHHLLVTRNNEKVGNGLESIGSSVLLARRRLWDREDTCNDIPGLESNVLQQVAKYTVKCWKALGRELHLDESALDAIDHEVKSISDKGTEMLLLWKRKSGREATNKVLFNALCEVSMKSVAEKFLQSP